MHIYTYLNRNVIEFSDKSMFDPINKIFRRYNGNQIRADHIKMLCKDKNVINVKRGCQGFSFWQMEKKALYLSVNIFTMKVLIKDLFLGLQLETVTPVTVTPWSSESRESLAVCTAKGVPSFLSYFKTLSIGPVPGIEPATSRSAAKGSIDSCPFYEFGSSILAS